MTTYNAFLRGEDGTEFTVSVDADNVQGVYEEVGDMYLEAKIIEIVNPAVRAAEIYRRVSDEDYEHYYDY